MKILTSILMSITLCASAYGAHGQASVVVELSRAGKKEKQRSPAPEALVWLEPLVASPAVHAVPWPTKGPYRLLQKNKMFLPHLLVVPVGTSVTFPNADPFFHNVFSLFEGSRFDLGLYEAGSTRDVLFSREGISYIFCNIHPEMAAVIVALDTPLWGRGVGDGTVVVSNVPAGNYRVHVWVEGQPPRTLDGWTHTIHVTGVGVVNAGSYTESGVEAPPHLNEFGRPYAPETSPY